MLKLTKKADYGLMALKYLAEHPETPALSAKDIADAVAELGATLSFGSSQGESTIFLSSMTENFDAALALLADVLMNPTFPQDELDKWKTREKAQLEQAKS